MRGNVRAANVATPASRRGAFLAVSYNIHQCVGMDGRRDVERIARVLSSLDAQLIGLQEVGTDFESGKKSGQMEYLARATGLQAIAGHTIEQQTGPFGNVLLTSWPILESRLLDLSVPGREPRGAIDAHLTINGETVRVIVTHLGLRAAERRYQVRRVLEALSHGQSRFIIVLGDINEWVLRSRPLRWLYGRFGTPPAPRTFPSWCPLFALDRIWVLPREMLLEVHAHSTPLTHIASDHLPVKGIIALEPGISARKSSLPLHRPVN
jgi:endonuclease/exonuclease/phosphatase family metal-dependent hydrolase